MHSLILLLALSAQDRPQFTLSNAHAEATFDLGGGSFVSFHLKPSGVNPLRWLGPADINAPNRAMAHFLCLDRWGAPSDAELANGMPYHGEAARVLWKLAASTPSTATMTASLPMAGLEVNRRIQISPQASLITVDETVTNRNKLGKLYNMVQHPTIGPPFLDESTLVDSNARRGFMQSSPMPNPEYPTVTWPQALKDHQPVNMRELHNDPLPNVVSYTIDEPLGWATATNAKLGLLIGYLWKTSDYPWFNAWRHVDEQGKPLARGLEFGTTGLHQPFNTLVQKGSIFGRPIFTHLDSGETITRSWSAFLIAIPPDWRGVERIFAEHGKLILVERGSPRCLQLESTPPWL